MCLFVYVNINYAGNLERVEQLLQQGVDVNEVDGDGASALHWAAINNRKEIVR